MQLFSREAQTFKCGLFLSHFVFDNFDDFRPLQHPRDETSVEKCRRPTRLESRAAAVEAKL